jgi:hypothetical protein
MKMKRTAHLWGVTAAWYDKYRSGPPFLSSRKQSAIDELKENFPGCEWPRLKREGWYVARITLTWDAP